MGNGTYKNEETAAHASDTLAKLLITNGEKDHKLNFPDDTTEMFPETKREKYFGLSYNEKYAKWQAMRWSKYENKNVYNGTYKDEETAAHASDTLARKLIANGENGHKLNFPDDRTEVRPEKRFNYIGVFYNEKYAKWQAGRRSKNENKNVYNGTYKNEKTAAHASDTLARKFIANGEKGHQINFPDDDTEIYPEKRNNFIGVSYNKKYGMWCTYRHRKNDKKTV